MTEQEPTYDADDWYAMGAEAFRSGKPLDLCPDYDADPDAAHYWSQGWHSAAAEQRAEYGE